MLYSAELVPECLMNYLVVDLETVRRDSIDLH